MLIAATLIACFLSGVLAGIDLDSVVVRFPAWRHLGSHAWATYSREADLGNGIVLYPLLAIGHTLLIIAVVFGVRQNGPFQALAAAYSATGLAIAGLLLTAGAAPVMLGLKRIGNDPVALDNALRAFARWSTFRAVAQVLAFIATLDLLVRVSA